MTHLEEFAKLERMVLAKLSEGALIGSLKSLNQEFSGSLKISNPKIIKSLLNFWKIKNWLIRTEPAHDEISLNLKLPAKDATKWIERKLLLSQFVVRYLHDLLKNQKDKIDKQQYFVYLEFSIGELQKAFN